MYIIGDILACRKGTVRELSQTDIRYSSRVTIYIRRRTAERREKGGMPFLYVKYNTVCFTYNLWSLQSNKQYKILTLQI